MMVLKNQTTRFLIILLIINSFSIINFKNQIQQSSTELQLQNYEIFNWTVTYCTEGYSKGDKFRFDITNFEEGLFDSHSCNLLNASLEYYQSSSKNWSIYTNNSHYLAYNNSQGYLELVEYAKEQLFVFYIPSEVTIHSIAENLDVLSYFIEEKTIKADTGLGIEYEITFNDQGYLDTYLYLKNGILVMKMELGNLNVDDNPPDGFELFLILIFVIVLSIGSVLLSYFIKLRPKKQLKNEIDDIGTEIQKKNGKKTKKKNKLKTQKTLKHSPKVLEERRRRNSKS